MKKLLTKEDFKYIPAYRYYSYKDPKVGVEVALEPCFNGFCVGLYLIRGIGPIREKECTDEKGYGSEGFIKMEVMAGLPQIRKPKTWNHALEIANKFWSSLANHLKARKMEILKVEDGETDPVYSEIEIKKPIHGISPKGRI